MKNLPAMKSKFKHAFLYFFSILFLMMVLPSASAQNSEPGQGSDRPSQSEQASGYLQNIEKDPNGVPNTSAWYAQPWIWAIVAAILILIIGVVARNSGRREVESGSENGLR